MHEVELAEIDLNLLVALEALLREESVSRAADRLGRSQPAISRSLARLRVMFDDPLLVASGRNLVLTERAIELRTKLAPVLEEIGGLLEPPSFDLATAKAQFSIDCPTAASMILVTRLIGQAAVEAPGIEFKLSNNPEGRFAALRTGEVDLVIDTLVHAPEDFYRQRLYENKLLCVCRPDHPAGQGGLTLEDYVAWPHVRIDTATTAVLETYLAQLKIKCRWAVRAASYVTAADIVSRTDYLVTLPEFGAAEAMRLCQLETHPLPFEIGGLGLDQLWHERSHRDPAHMWLRTAVVEIAKDRLREST